MLILTRTVDEKLFIKVGNITISITTIEISQKRVKLGFEAPREVVILRDNCKKGTK